MLNSKWHSDCITALKAGKAFGMLLFFFILLSGLNAYSQSFFYFQSKFTRPAGPELVHYCFLVVESDGTAKARVRYKEPVTGTDHIVELSLTDSLMPELGVNPTERFLVPDAEPFDLTGNTDTALRSLRFRFKRESDSSGSYYVPIGEDLMLSDMKWIPAVLQVNQQKTLEDLLAAPDFVRVFYLEDDDFYKYIFGNNTRGPLGEKRKERFFLVLVAGTNDPTIGTAVKKDLSKIDTYFSTLANDLGVEYIPTYVTGNDFTRQNVLRAVGQLEKAKPAPIDIVVFYYSGHGFRYSNDSSKYPRMSMRRNDEENRDTINVGLEEVYDRMIKLGAKVTMVIGDLCNEDKGLPVPVGREVLKPKINNKGFSTMLNRDNASALFFPKAPISILVGSAEPNQLAVGNPSTGSFFTDSFLSQLEQSFYGPLKNPSWLRLLGQSRELTRRKSLAGACPTGSRTRCIQTAVISVVPPQ